MASGRNIIRVLSPDYCSAVTEDTLIRLQVSDLSRYGIIDLYADFVRVYAG